jgi:two-component system, cell cycle response regulator
MIRITKRVFTDLAIYMTGFGVLIGLCFPFFLTMIGVSPSLAFTPWFFSICVAAGLIVGLVNIILARSVVGRRIAVLVDKMRDISSHLENSSHDDIVNGCDLDKCLIEVDSADLLGESATSYNNLVASLFASIKSELMVRDFSSMLTLRLELGDLAQATLPALLRATATEAGAIIMEREGELVVITSSRIADPNKLVGNSVVAEVVEGGKRKLLDIPGDLRVEGVLVDFSPRSVWVEPLLYHDVALGAIVLASATAVRPEALHFLDLVNASLAIAFRNALTYDQLQQLAANDSLTGMFNRRFGMARLQEEYGRAIRSGSPVGICLFDLDHFKLVNDTYGHPTGDKVLVHVSKILRGALREGDVALRYGGEEFMIVLPGASITDAFDIADRIRRLVAETVFQHGSNALALTISGGAAAWPDFDAASADALVRRADESLYKAKEEGRNRIVAL